MKTGVMFCALGVLIASACPILAQPVNDNLADRTILLGTNLTVTAVPDAGDRQVVPHGSIASVRCRRLSKFPNGAVIPESPGALGLLSI